MKSLKYHTFNKHFNSLPEEIKEISKNTFKKWKDDPSSFEFTLINSSNKEVLSAAVNYRYRALAVRTKVQGENALVWFWTGSHEDYNKLVFKKEAVANTIKNIRAKYKHTNDDDFIKLHSPKKLNN